MLVIAYSMSMPTSLNAPIAELIVILKVILVKRTSLLHTPADHFKKLIKQLIVSDCCTFNPVLCIYLNKLC